MLHTINKAIEERRLLKHDFYQFWSEGKLSKPVLLDYSKQCYRYISNYSRYISGIHSQTANLRSRQILLEILVANERGTENHLKLWCDFAAELGLQTEDLESAEYNAETNFVADKFIYLTRDSYASGLGAIYAYKYQSSGISNLLMNGLQESYQISNNQALKYFKVRKELDMWHAQEISAFILKLSTKDQAKAFTAALQISDAFLIFLDGMIRVHKL
jgi:pyrroloquinoline-quinone synthase